MTGREVTLEQMEETERSIRESLYGFWQRGSITQAEYHKAISEGYKDTLMEAYGELGVVQHWIFDW